MLDRSLDPFQLKVLSGELVEETRCSEALIEKAFQKLNVPASRTVVRELFAALSVFDLVGRQPGVASTIPRLNASQAQFYNKMRAEMEMLSIMELIKRIVDMNEAGRKSLLENLHQKTEAMYECGINKDNCGLFTADLEFHSELVQLAGYQPTKYQSFAFASTIKMLYLRVFLSYQSRFLYSEEAKEKCAGDLPKEMVAAAAQDFTRIHKQVYYFILGADKSVDETRVRSILDDHFSQSLKCWHEAYEKATGGTASLIDTKTPFFSP